MKAMLAALALLVGAGAIVPLPAQAQEQRPECRTAQRLLQELSAPGAGSGGAAAAGARAWPVLAPPLPVVVAGWLPGPLPRPTLAVGWVLPPPSPLLLAGPPAAAPRGPSRAELVQAVRQLGDYACALQGDPALAQQYADLVNVLGYLQGDVADALEAPAREILATGESPRVRELAAAILAAIATLRRGGAP